MDRLPPFLVQRLPPFRLLRAFLAVLAVLMPISVYLMNVSLGPAHQLRLLAKTGAKIPTAVDLLWETSDIYVISLPSRQDRRRDMERLRVALGLEWSFVDAYSAESRLVLGIMDWVMAIRARLPSGRIIAETDTSPVNSMSFSWPDNLEELARSTQEIELWSSIDSPWDLPTDFGPPSAYRPIACATGDYTIPGAPLPEYLILTPARVACWRSHLSVIHRFANNNLPDAHGVALIFEDDVDMEKDIRQQTQALWPSLPGDWDVVFLGHCWSDEGLGTSLSAHIASAAAHSQLFTSTGPKCTHAYALSRIGARRLLLHLRHPPFAYSRAIDQAFAWLVHSGRLKSFSVVPSLVIQRKLTKSDVTPGNGSNWKETLVNGIL
ncbi:hypothetical protein BDN70DRAFT_843041, partial [Pholiota conissans]